MPNGFEGSDEQWRRHEHMLLEWDEVLCKFAREKALKLVKNARAWPSRSFEWVDLSIKRKIEVVAIDLPVDTFTVWAYAWKDIGTRRFARTFTIRENVSAAEMAIRLGDILSEAWNNVSGCSESDLVAVTNIDPPKC
jgi:hypothetical protein